VHLSNLALGCSQVMDSDEEVFDLPDEWAIDPREALYNDYQDGVSTAEQTLLLIGKLSEEGLLPNSFPSQLWREFVDNLLQEVQKHSKL
jgi:hypothetical protein